LVDDTIAIVVKSVADLGLGPDVSLACVGSCDTGGDTKGASACISRRFKSWVGTGYSYALNGGFVNLCIAVVVHAVANFAYAATDTCAFNVAHVAHQYAWGA